MRFGVIKRGLLLAACALLLSSAANAASDQGQLSAQEQKVIDYLVNDWGQDFSVTSVDIAMGALKVEQSDDTRFRIGNYIKTHPELHEIVRRWGWVTLVLTPDEKLIARALINADRDAKPTPSTAELAKVVGVSEADVKRGLNMRLSDTRSLRKTVAPAKQVIESCRITLNGSLDWTSSFIR